MIDHDDLKEAGIYIDTVDLETKRGILIKLFENQLKARENLKKEYEKMKKKYPDLYIEFFE